MEREFGQKFENSAFWRGLAEVIRWAMIICSVCCTGVIIISCIMRYCFTKNWYGSDEIILMFAFWLYFMGAVYGSYENSHIKADIIPTLVKNMRVKDAITLAAQALLLVVNMLLIIWAIPYVTEAIHNMPRTTALKIPLVIPRIAILTSLILMEFYHIYYFIKNAYLFIKRGYYSKPNDDDYFPAKLRNKYPNVTLRTKEQVEADNQVRNLPEGEEVKTW